MEGEAADLLADPQVHEDGKAIDWYAGWPGEVKRVADLESSRRAAILSQVDLMLVPIGDNFTMGVADAIRAVELVKPKNVIPMHYNTWDVIKADPEEFRRGVGNTSAVTILQPGESFTLP